MNPVSVEVNQWYESLTNQKLRQNDESTVNWSKYENDLNVTKSLLSILPKKVTHDVMVPIGPKALMRGKIVHTNEFLVNLGETWFVKRTASQTEEICNRRIEACNEMLQKLEKEREIILSRTNLPVEQEAFGSDSRPEIIEYETEEESEEWKKRHKIREKEYRQKLAELRSKQMKKFHTEEDVWKRLDELELIEELEDELNRLSEDKLNSSSDDSESETLECSNISQDVHRVNVSDFGNSNIVESNGVVNCCEDRNLKKTKERRVSFACDFDFSDDEPLKLVITHSDGDSVQCSDDSVINSPADIYNRYIKSLNITHKPVLKIVNNPNREKELENIEKEKGFDSSEGENENETCSENKIPVTNSFAINDVIERTPFSLSSLHVSESKTKKLSKFKASRVKPAHN